MASPGQPLAYAPYHRRSQSTASTNSIGNNGIPPPRTEASSSSSASSSASSAAPQRAAQPSSTAASTTVVNRPRPPPVVVVAPPPPSAPAASGYAAPPPLRTAASIRAAQQKQKVPSAAPSIQGKRVVSSSPATKEKSQVTSAAQSDGPSEPAASNGTSSPKERPTSPPASHARNSSSVPNALAGVPAVPQHISTAVRLRTAAGTGNTSSTSNSGSSTPTARTQSPAFGGDSGTFGFGGGALPTSAYAQQVALLGSGEVPASQQQDGAPSRHTPYRPGFQPKGVYRLRTDEFRGLRAEKKREKKGPRVASDGVAAVDDLEGQRMERRLEKLMALHFPPQADQGAPALPPPPPSNEQQGFTWRSVLQATRAGRKAEEERRLREKEMELVRWEGDHERSGCAICTTSFSLAVRRHHCRLCGRLVCASPHLSLPPALASLPGPHTTSSDRNVSDLKCSGLVDADKMTGKLRDVPKLPPGSTKAGPAGEAAVAERKGVRICRDCREVIVRRQYMMDPGHVPRYLKLYEELTKLQREIEQTLPEFQEMVLGLQKQDAAAALGTDDLDSSPSSRTAAKAALLLQRDAATARKQLLLNFANYDQLAKRIRSLEPEPDLDGPAVAGGGSQADSAQVRLQTAIWTRANLFLQQNMFPLQSLPTTSKRASAGHNRTASTASSTTSSAVIPGKGPDAGDAAAPTQRDASWASRFAGRGAVQAHGGGDARSLSAQQAEADAEARRDPEAAREALEVLEQQLEQVKAFAASAGRARKLEDARTLKGSAEELSAEVARRREALRKLGAKR